MTRPYRDRDEHQRERHRQLARECARESRAILRRGKSPKVHPGVSHRETVRIRLRERAECAKGTA